MGLLVCQRLFEILIKRLKLFSKNGRGSSLYGLGCVSSVDFFFKEEALLIETAV